MDLKVFKEVFDLALKEYIDQKINQAKTLLDNKKLNGYIEYIQTFISSGGKRIRPYCLWSIYKGFGGQQDKDIIHFGIIFELFHTMALIHDDIIDQSEKRHNVPTMHNHIVASLGKQQAHIAMSQALLIGDLILSWVYELANKPHPFQGSLLQDARNNVHSMIEEVILGQMIDVDMMTGEIASQAMIDKKNTFKTGSYTFVRPMLTGAILANVDQTNKDKICVLGNYLGLAFQVRDDLMDITCGDETKSLFSDIQEGQQTHFTNYIITHGTPDQVEYLKSCMGKSLTDQEIENLQQIFEMSGAIAAGKTLINEYANQAKQVLATIDFVHPDGVQTINALIEKIARIG